ncbi:MAG TPA: hypothetical protein VD835_13055, partial [Pyrinomonadaceae bacterium]|nr:hypothetical protein [Pyrinomonadaceae bacterium]
MYHRIARRDNDRATRARRSRGSGGGFINCGLSAASLSGKVRSILFISTENPKQHTMNQTKSFLRAISTLLLLVVCAADAPAQSRETTKAAPVTDTLRATTAAPGARDERLWQRTLKLQRSAIVVDSHNDILSIMLDENYDLGQSSVG